jgi:hypothetical protein
MPFQVDDIERVAARDRDIHVRCCRPCAFLRERTHDERFPQAPSAGPSDASARDTLSKSDLRSASSRLAVFAIASSRTRVLNMSKLQRVQGMSRRHRPSR